MCASPTVPRACLALSLYPPTPQRRARFDRFPPALFLPSPSWHTTRGFNNHGWHHNTQRLYEEFLKPILLVGLFAPPEELSAGVVLGMLYFYVLAHQPDFDVR